MRIPFAIVIILLIGLMIRTVSPQYKILFNLNSFKLYEVKIDSVSNEAGIDNYGYYVYSNDLPNKRIKLNNLRNRDKPINVWSSNCCTKAYLSNKQNEFPLFKVLSKIVLNTLIIMMLLFFLILLIRSIKLDSTPSAAIGPAG